MMENKLQQMQAGRPLKPDHSFNFKCSGCGRCCYYHDDILLSGYDLYRLAKFLNIPVEDVIRNYCIVTIGGTSKLPVVTLNTLDDGACPLLKDDKCSVHEAKPHTCSLYPLGRIVDPESKDIQYVLQNKSALPPDCESTTNTTHTLKDWLARFNISDSDEDILAWYDSLFTLLNNQFMEKFRANPERVTQSTFQVIIHSLIQTLYTKFDMDKPYSEQAKQNIKDITPLLVKLSEAVFN